MPIQIYDKYSNVSNLPTSGGELIHGLSPAQISEMKTRFDTFNPDISRVASPSNRFRDQFGSLLPDGASWDSRTAQTLSTNGFQGGGRNLTTVQQPYQPEFASPDRQNYPVHRILANRYWRLFHKLDPLIGNCIDLYADLPWSNFELTGEGVEGEIRQAYEYMCRETQLLAILPHFVREFLVVGEAVPHCYFDSEKGVFTHVALHNPDQIEVIDAPFIKMDPVLEFIPDDRLRAVLTSNNPALKQVRDRMPPELIGRLQSNQNISLSPINATFIPRKLHPYDTRGTSIISRMWRVLMLEDAVFNASIQIARRHASPLKVAKLGNPSTGFIPPAEQEKRFAEMLAQSEQDPNAWLIYHYGVSFETIGTTDRAISISREWDILERIKLVALGVSKSFVHGEVTYASSATGLQVFMQRLKVLRMFFEQKWLYPKYFKVIAEINGWVKPKPSEVAHRFRVKRSKRELDEQNAYIIPRVVWDKSLDTQINSELVAAIQNLESIGVKFSKTTKMAAVGHSYEEETKKIARENEFEKQYRPAIQNMSQPGGGAGGGAPMPSIAPPPAPDSSSSAGGDIAAPSDNLEVKSDKDNISVSDSGSSKNTKALPFNNLKSDIWTNSRFGNWDAEEVSDLISLIETGDTDSAFWHHLSLGDAPLSNPIAMWDQIDEYLSSRGYPDGDIDELRRILQYEKILSTEQHNKILSDIEDSLPDNADSLSDEQFATLVAAAIKNSPANHAADSFLTGLDSTVSPTNLVFDLGTITRKK